jgi:hypothetical protein
MSGRDEWECIASEQRAWILARLCAWMRCEQAVGHARTATPLE